MMALDDLYNELSRIALTDLCKELSKVTGTQWSIVSDFGNWCQKLAYPDYVFTVVGEHTVYVTAVDGLYYVVNTKAGYYDTFLTERLDDITDELWMVFRNE